MHIISLSHPEGTRGDQAEFHVRKEKLAACFDSRVYTRALILQHGQSITCYDPFRGRQFIAFEDTLQPTPDPIDFFFVSVAHTV